MSNPLALMTPMANPTVERETHRLLPPDCDYLVGRLVGTEADPMARLRAYAENLPTSLRQFGGLTLAGVAFACTASSYLIGQAGERRIAAEIGIPVLWAAAAIRTRLAALGAQRIAVISPYPDALHAAGLSYWQESGLQVIFNARVEIGSPDTRKIYALDGSEARPALQEARQTDVDAILLSGTGMPTLALVDPQATPPVISSNLCLGEAMTAFQGIRQ